MANIVEFIVKLKDFASGPLGKIASVGGNSFSKLDQGLSKATGSFNRLGGSISATAKGLDQLGKPRRINIDSSQVRRASREMADLERRREGLGGRGGFSGLGGLAAGAMALAGIAGIGGTVSLGMERQLTAKRFEVMAGKEQGGQLNRELTKFAKDSIYGNEVHGAANTMLAFGINPKAVMPSLSALGDIAGGDKQRLGSLSLAFSQVAAAGRLMGQDLLQFVNAGFNPLQEISEKTGKSMAILKKEVEDGKISFLDVAGAIERATGEGGRFFNMTDDLSKTAPGKLLKLQGSLQGAAAEVGSGMLSMMEPLIDFSQWLLDSPALLDGLIAGMGVLAAGLAIWQVQAKWTAISQMLLNVATLWPVFAIAAVIGIIAALISKYDGWGDAMEALWTIIKAWASNVGIAFKDAFEAIVYRIEHTWLKIKHFVQYVGGAFTNLGKAFALAKEGEFSKATQVLTAEIRTKASGEIEALERRRTEQHRKNLFEVASNFSTIQSTGVLSKLVAKEGKSPADTKPQGLLSSLGLDMLNGGGMPAAPGAAREAADGISSGGAKSVKIEIHKFFDNVIVNTDRSDSGLDHFEKQLEERLLEVMLRVTNSGNAITR